MVFFLAFFFFLVWNNFLSLYLLTFVVHNLSRLWIEMVPMYLFVRLLRHCEVSPSGDQTSAFESLWSIIITGTVSSVKLYAISICSIFRLCMESNTLEKSTSKIVTSRFFARTPSTIRRIWESKKLWSRFFLRTFSTTGLIRLRSRAYAMLEVHCVLEVLS